MTMTKIFAFLASSSEKRPWLVVGCVALVTLFLLSGMARLKTEFSQEGMMPRHYESVKALETVGDEFGGLSYESVLVVADDVRNSRISDALIGLSPEKLEEEGVKEGQVLQVETYLDGLKKMAEARNAPVPSGLMLAAAVRQYLETQYAREQIIGKTITPDGRATLVKLQLDADLQQNDLLRLAGQLDDFFTSEFEASGAEVYMTGSASLEKEAQEYMQRQTSILLIAALLFILLILYMTFRRVSDVFLLIFVIVVGIFWIMGLMGWVGIAYTTMSVAIMPLMLGINIAYVIHILSRYYEEREAGAGIALSATTSIKTVGVAVFLTAVTTLFGFSSFMITDIPPMREFGIVCMLGIAFAFLLALTLLPALLVIRDRRKKAERLEAHLEKMRKRRRESRYGAVTDRGLLAASMTAYRHHWVVTICVALLIGFAVFSIFNLKTGADVRAMMGEDLPSIKASEKIAEHFGEQDADVILVEGDVLEPGSLRAFLDLEEAIAEDGRNRSLEKGEFTREGNISIADILANAGGGALPESEEDVKRALDELGKQMNTGSFVSADGRYALVMLRSGAPRTQDETEVKVDVLRDQSDAMERGTGLRATATGLSVLIADLMGNIINTQLETSGLALVLCLLVLIIVFRSFSYGLVTLIVVTCGMSAEVIFLFLTGWPLDIMTVTVASLVIGAGIDFGIHVTHRFREQRYEQGLSIEESVRSTVLHVGRALLAGAFTTAGVFGILGISTMIALRHFGWTTAVGLLGSLAGALFVLPSLLVILSKAKNNRSEKAAGVAAVAAAGEEPGEQEA